MGDVVWIQGIAEISVSGVDVEESWISVPRAEWDAMTEDEQQAVLDDAAHAALEALGVSYGSEVIDDADVPDSVKAGA